MDFLARIPKRAAWRSDTPAGHAAIPRAMKRFPAPPSRGSWEHSGAVSSTESTTAPRPTLVPCTSSPTKPSLASTLRGRSASPASTTCSAASCPTPSSRPKPFRTRWSSPAPPLRRAGRPSSATGSGDAVLSGYTVFTAEDARLRVLAPAGTRAGPDERGPRQGRAWADRDFRSWRNWTRRWTASNRPNWLSTALSWRRT